MNPQQANTLIIDCGRMVGHQQTELELPQDVVPFFNLTAREEGPCFLNTRVSNGLLAAFRAIYRRDNGMWRIELSNAVPEIQAGVFPVVNGQRQKRSNHAAVFVKIGAAGPAQYDLALIPLTSSNYQEHLAQAQSRGRQARTLEDEHGRNYGWY